MECFDTPIKNSPFHHDTIKTSYVHYANTFPNQNDTTSTIVSQCLRDREAVVSLMPDLLISTQNIVGLKSPAPRFTMKENFKGNKKKIIIGKCYK